jgi:hypothetical protein
MFDHASASAELIVRQAVRIALDRKGSMFAEFLVCW